jgi:hypothetical protein
MQPDGGLIFGRYNSNCKVLAKPERSVRGLQSMSDD